MHGSSSPEPEFVSNLLPITDSVIRSKYVCVKICPFLGHFSILDEETIFGMESSEGWW